MKYLNFQFEDKIFKQLLKAKGKKTWWEFLFKEKVKGGIK